MSLKYRPWSILAYEHGMSTPVLITHCGRVTHICVAYLTVIASDNGLSPSRRQAIIWTNAEILIIRSSGTNVSEIVIEINIFPFKKMHLKMSSAKRAAILYRPQCVNGARVWTQHVALSTVYRMLHQYHVNVFWLLTLWHYDTFAFY